MLNHIFCLSLGLFSTTDSTWYRPACVFKKLGIANWTFLSFECKTDFACHRLTRPANIFSFLPGHFWVGVRQPRGKAEPHLYRRDIWSLDCAPSSRAAADSWWAQWPLASYLPQRPSITADWETEPLFSRRPSEGDALHGCLSGRCSSSFYWSIHSGRLTDITHIHFFFPPNMNLFKEVSFLRLATQDHQLSFPLCLLPLYFHSAWLFIGSRHAHALAHTELLPGVHHKVHSDLSILLSAFCHSNNYLAAI